MAMRFFSLFAVLALLALSILPAAHVYAAQIEPRSLTLQAGAGGDGGSMPGGTVNHLLAFSLPTAGTLGSILFEYCTTAAGTCDVPTGLDTTGTSLGSQSGATGFTLDNTVNGAPMLTRTAAAISASTAVSYQLANVVNPDPNPGAKNETFFVRISTFASNDGTGAYTDLGNVTASVNEQILLSGVMPESLIFCTGETIGLNGSVPDCSTVTTGIVEFNQLFSPTDTATAMSQMAASTNAGSGYSITVNGTTLTSGSNTITPMASATTIARGTSQFGLNLVENTIATSTVPVGIAISDASNGTNLRAAPAADYATPDTFKYANGDVVARSDDGGAGATDAQIMTVSYIVNVPGSQAAGTYSTTLTYICTATY